jgi:hypothetical protein
VGWGQGVRFYGVLGVRKQRAMQACLHKGRDVPRRLTFVPRFHTPAYMPRPTCALPLLVRATLPGLAKAGSRPALCRWRLHQRPRGEMSRLSTTIAGGAPIVVRCAIEAIAATAMPATIAIAATPAAARAAAVAGPNTGQG